jgi:hypothetical protein
MNLGEQVITTYERSNVALRQRGIWGRQKYATAVFALLGMMVVSTESVAQEPPASGSFTWSGSGSMPPPGIPPRDRSGRAPPDYWIEIDGGRSPEKFSRADLSVALFDTIRALSASPTDMARSFLSSEVGLSDSQVDSVLGAARAREGGGTFDAVSERTKLCEILKVSSDGSAAAAAFEESAARAAQSATRRAEAQLALLDEETAKKVDAWLSSKVRPTAKRIVIDYQKFFAQPGALEMMRERVCAAPENR